MCGPPAEGEVGVEEVEAGHLSSFRATFLRRRRQGTLSTPVPTAEATPALELGAAPHLASAG